MLREIIERIKVGEKSLWDKYGSDVRKEGKDIYLHYNIVKNPELGGITWILNLKNEKYNNKPTIELDTGAGNMTFIKEGKNKFSLNYKFGNGTGVRRLIHIDLDKKYYTSDDIFNWTEELSEEEDLIVSPELLRKILDQPFTTSNVIPEKEIKNAEWYFDGEGSEFDGLPNLSCSDFDFFIAVYKENGKFRANIETYNGKIFGNYFKAEDINQERKPSKSPSLILLNLSRVLGTSMPSEELIKKLEDA